MVLEHAERFTEAGTLTSQLRKRVRHVFVIGGRALRFIVEAEQFIRGAIWVVHLHLEAILAEALDTPQLVVRNLDEDLLVFRYLLSDELNFVL